METDHLVPSGEGGGDEIENCLPVCFECHAEIHSYNDEHPRGRKFRPEELQLHREQWLRICDTRPEVFTEPPREADVGPLQALIDELEFNAKIASRASGEEVGCLFHDEQFRRAVKFGAVSIIFPELKSAVIEAYAVMGMINQTLTGWASAANQTDRIFIQREVTGKLALATPVIEKAHEELLNFLGTPGT